MRARRVVVTLAATGLAAAAAVPALAHTDVVSSGPRSGAVVKHLPKTVVINFGEPLQTVESGQVLLGTSNRAVTARLNPKNASQVRIATRQDTQGLYTVKVKLVTADGHHQQISYRFRVKR